MRIKVNHRTTRSVVVNFDNLGIKKVNECEYVFLTSKIVVPEIRCYECKNRMIKVSPSVRNFKWVCEGCGLVRKIYR